MRGDMRWKWSYGLMKQLLTHIYVSMISFLLFTITQNMLSVPVRCSQELWTLLEAPWYSLLGICVYHHRKFNFSFWGEMKPHWGPLPRWAEVKWLTCRLLVEVSRRKNSRFIFIQSTRLVFTAVLSSWRCAKLVKILIMSIIVLTQNLFVLFLNNNDWDIYLLHLKVQRQMICHCTNWRNVLQIHINLKVMQTAY